MEVARIEVVVSRCIVVREDAIQVVFEGVIVEVVHDRL